MLRLAPGYSMPAAPIASASQEVAPEPEEAHVGRLEEQAFEKGQTCSWIPLD